MLKAITYECPDWDSRVRGGVGGGGVSAASRYAVIRIVGHTDSWVYMCTSAGYICVQPLKVLAAAA